MSAKPEAKEAKEAAPAEKAAPAAGGGGAKSWLPAIVAVIVAPAASFAVAQYVLLPKIKEQLGAPATPAGEHAEAAHAEEAAPAAEEGGGHGKKGGKEGEAGGSGNYEYTNVVVNLAGTMGTRYLKVSFVVTGVKGVSTKPLFEAQKPKLTDITLNVLSSLSLADLEEPGSKNLLREKLVLAYNQALGKRVVDQIYFSDFVVQ